MPKTINYRQLMKKALHGFVADVLAQVARDGLPGKHYFFITFDTTHPGVDMNAALKARYPTEMTIVLQEWFADLAVMKDRFTVTLNFGNVPEPIVVPFDAIKTFVDPSVEFGLKFDAHDEDGQLDAGQDETLVVLDEPPHPAQPPKPGEGEVVRLDKFRKHEPGRS
ncbi:MAG: ClpXP protease specificity-enhancing factor SspB [Amaricoccus sp.]